MAKYRNTVSGVVVDVDEPTAMRLPGKWEPLDAEPKKAAPRKRASSRKKAEPEPDQAPEAESGADTE